MTPDETGSRTPALLTGAMRLGRAHPLLAILLLLILCSTAQAQGCSQCLDSTRATPPQVQAGYRHAILLLGGFAVTIFITGALLLRRDP